MRQLSFNKFICLNLPNTQIFIEILISSLSLDRQNDYILQYTILSTHKTMYGSMNQCHKQLIDQLRKNGTINSQKVYQTLLQIDRKYFVPKPPYYYDRPQSIGYGATISAPHMHAYALQYLQDRIIKAKNILDVGSGTGILTLAMALMAPQYSKVYGIEHIPQLVQLSLCNIQKSHPEILKNKIHIKIGDGRKGWPDSDIKFDVIHVGAAPNRVPQPLLQQLADGGVMVIPVGGQHQTQKYMRIQKHGEQIIQKNMHLVRYVPLTDLQHQIGRK